MLAKVAVLMGTILLGAVVPVGAEVRLQSPQVEYRTTPLGIDVTQPRFSWHMRADAGERAVTQTAYRLEVRDPSGAVAWDSGRREDGRSLGITYAGAPLRASTRYTWTATAWTGDGRSLQTTSWFETGLMDPSPTSPAWGGAQWIGGGDDDLVLYAPYLAIFELSYAVTIPAGSTHAGFVYGANDSRLMDANKNVHRIAHPKDGSYISLVLDDPTFPKAIWCNLLLGERPTGLPLMWDRPVKFRP